MIFTKDSGSSFLERGSEMRKPFHSLLPLLARGTSVSSLWTSRSHLFCASVCICVVLIWGQRIALGPWLGAPSSLSALSWKCCQHSYPSSPASLGAVPELRAQRWGSWARQTGVYSSPASGSKLGLSEPLGETLCRLCGGGQFQAGFWRRKALGQKGSACYGWPCTPAGFSSASYAAAAPRGFLFLSL